MRLIDADACPCNTCRTLCCEHPMQCYRFYTWRKNQAYDVEKVVSELEKQAEHYNTRPLELVEKSTEAGIHNKGKARSYEHAIEIVRSGGVE